MILSQVPILSPPPHLPFFKKKKKKTCLYVQIFPLLITFISFILIVHYQPPLFSFHSIFCMLLLYSLNNLFLVFHFFCHSCSLFPYCCYCNYVYQIYSHHHHYCQQPAQLPYMLGPSNHITEVAETQRKVLLVHHG